MRCPDAWPVVNDILWRLPLHQSKAFWYALAEARTTRPVALRHYITLLGHMPLDMDHACGKIITPHTTIAAVEALVRERELRRSQATHIEESLLQQVDALGCWLGDEGRSQVACSALPPDVVRFADIGTM